MWAYVLKEEALDVHGGSFKLVQNYFVVNFLKVHSIGFKGNPQNRAKICF